MGAYTASDIEEMRETLKDYGEKSESYYDNCTPEQIVDQYERKAGVRE